MSCPCQCNASAPAAAGPVTIIPAADLLTPGSQLFAARLGPECWTVSYLMWSSVFWTIYLSREVKTLIHRRGLTAGYAGYYKYGHAFFVLLCAWITAVNRANCCFDPAWLLHYDAMPYRIWYVPWVQGTNSLALICPSLLWSAALKDYTHSVNRHAEFFFLKLVNLMSACFVTAAIIMGITSGSQGPAYLNAMWTNIHKLSMAESSICVIIAVMGVCYVTLIVDLPFFRSTSGILILTQTLTCAVLSLVSSTFLYNVNALQPSWVENNFIWFFDMYVTCYMNAIYCLTFFFFGRDNRRSDREPQVSNASSGPAAPGPPHKKISVIPANPAGAVNLRAVTGGASVSVTRNSSDSINHQSVTKNKSDGGGGVIISATPKGTISSPLLHGTYVAVIPTVITEISAAVMLDDDPN